MLVSETHFTNKSHFSMPNYMFYHTNHPDETAHGGSAIIIKTQIKHHAAEEYRQEYLQATTVVIDDWTGPLAVSAIYCPPKHAIDHTLFESFFSQLGHRFLSGGDWNAKHPWWGSRLRIPTPRGRQLYEAIKKYNCFTISTGEPTYWPSNPRKSPDLIDFAIARGIHKNKNITARTSLDLSSDHSPVIITIDAPLKTTLRTRTKICWAKFKEIVPEKISCGVSICTVDDLENRIESFNAMLQSAVSAASTTTVLSHCHRKVSNQIEDKIREKRRLRKIWQSTRNAYTKRKLNKAINDLKALLLEEKNNDIASYLQKLTPTEANDYSLWKATKRINRPQNYIAPIRKNSGDWARTDHDKGLAFALHLSSVFKP
uniref:Endonuclease/exonuclease/phosphatase domain-containing protein n=1 Tax=Trichogramma kaykai TaxID=54128 RepID=A0ABD2XS64_9HYME